MTTAVCILLTFASEVTNCMQCWEDTHIRQTMFLMKELTVDVKTSPKKFASPSVRSMMQRAPEPWRYGI